MSKNLSAKHYQENKERLQKKARERCQNVSKEEKDKKQQHGHDRYINLQKKMLCIEKIYRKKYKMKKKHFIIIIRKYLNLENIASL